MALSGNVSTAQSSKRSVKLNWTATQNTTENKSDISWNLVGSGSAQGWVEVGALRVTINGSVVYSRDSSSKTMCYPDTNLANGSVTISHNTDGTKSFEVIVEAAINGQSINCRGNKTFTLNTIQRAASIISANSVVLGNNCSVAWKPTSTSFRYQLKFELGTWSSTTDLIEVHNTSRYTYTGTMLGTDIVRHINNSTVGTMTVYLYTYEIYDMTSPTGMVFAGKSMKAVGAASVKTFTVIVPSDTIPTITSASATIINENAVVSRWGVAVAGYTKVRVRANATAPYDARITGYTISYSIGDRAFNRIDWGEDLNFVFSGDSINYSGEKTYTIRARDTRGRESDAVTPASIIFYPYSDPEVTTFEVSRSASNSQRVSILANWDYASVNNNNSATAILQYKRKTNSSWIDYGDITGYKGVSFVLSSAVINDEYSYDFRVTVTDAIGNSASSTSSVATVPVLIDLRSGGKGIGLGKVAESDALEIALKTIFVGDVKVRIGGSDISLANYIKGVMNGTYS